MNPIKLLLIAALALLTTATARGDDQMNLTITLDELGDADIEMTMTMSAQQWQRWKQMYGGNPSMLRRDMGQLVGMYDVGKIDLEQDEMQRTMTMTVEARGVADYHGDGEYTVELEDEFGRGDLSGETFTFAYNQRDEDGGMFVKQRVVLPGAAQDIEQRTDSAGDPVLAYTLPAAEVEPVSTGPSWPLLIGGAVAFLLGLGLMPLSVLGKS